MNKVFKFLIFLIFSSLLIYIILHNIQVVKDEQKKVPSKEELEEFTNLPSSNPANTYQVKDISEKQLVEIYYIDFKNRIINDPKVYDIIRNKEKINTEIFNNFKTTLKNNYYNSKVVSYKKSKEGKQDVYIVENNYNQEIIFYVTSIMNYEIILNL